ncbi:phage virion morphogenesis protein [Wielerella bovis]|uniref:phage virion morphogenesis protein n=1 Tax=Wielerella bovis TaxID=2917790 RepID=UPI0020190288|nr:phage virion morphogenesis protein [Wielerella bovis]MCG7655964.1 phage virion morphogenesis protein [Wielerella bovis]
MFLIVNADFAPLQASLNHLQTRLGDLSEPLANIGNVLENSIRYRISNSKNAPDGKAWAQAKHAKKSGSLLVDTGGLMSGITYAASKNAVIVGSDKLYTMYLHYGTQNKDGSERLPARPIFGIAEQDYHDIDELLTDYLTGAFK